MKWTKVNSLCLFIISVAKKFSFVGIDLIQILLSVHIYDIFSSSLELVKTEKYVFYGSHESDKFRAKIAFTRVDFGYQNLVLSRDGFEPNSDSDSNSNSNSNPVLLLSNQKARTRLKKNCQKARTRNPKTRTENWAWKAIFNVISQIFLTSSGAWKMGSCVVYGLFRTKMTCKKERQSDT